MSIVSYKIALSLLYLNMNQILERRHHHHCGNSHYMLNTSLVNIFKNIATSILKIVHFYLNIIRNKVLVLNQRQIIKKNIRGTFVGHDFF